MLNDLLLLLSALKQQLFICMIIYLTWVKNHQFYPDYSRLFSLCGVKYVALVRVTRKPRSARSSFLITSSWYAKNHEPAVSSPVSMVTADSCSHLCSISMTQPKRVNPSWTQLLDTYINVEGHLFFHPGIKHIMVRRRDCVGGQPNVKQTEIVPEAPKFIGRLFKWKEIILKNTFIILNKYSSSAITT